MNMRPVGEKLSLFGRKTRELWKWRHGAPKSRSANLGVLRMKPSETPVTKCAPPIPPTSWRLNVTEAFTHKPFGHAWIGRQQAFALIARKCSQTSHPPCSLGNSQRYRAVGGIASQTIWHASSIFCRRGKVIVHQHLFFS